MNRQEAQNDLYRKDNPYENTNIVSKYFYTWMWDFFKIGMRRPIADYDLYRPLDSHKCNKISHLFNSMWMDEIADGRTPKLFKIFMKLYGWRCFGFGLVFSLLDTVAKILQPLCLGGLIKYFNPDQKEYTKQEGYLYAVGIILCSIIPTALFHPLMLYLFQMAYKLRLGCCSLIYSKILRMKESSMGDGLSGHVINLMSSDIYTFEWALSFFHELWTGPVIVMIVGYLLYEEAGYSALIGMTALLCVIPLQAWLGNKSASVRYKIGQTTDARVHNMGEVIHGIQVIKMYTWESYFAGLIKFLRETEISAIRSSSNIQATLLSFEIITRFSIFLCLIFYVTLGNDVTPSKIFIVTSFFNVLNNSMVKYWPLALTSVAEGLTSFRRVEDFLMKNERKPNKTNERYSRVYEQTNSLPTGSIVMKNVTARWNPENITSRNGLYSLNLEFHPANLYCIIGSVGCGKTSFLQVILRELERDSGDLIVNGTVSYASQDPWLFEGTIRDNIIFVQSYDHERYMTVVKCCALEQDFYSFADGDQTVVGERGISLSGGQKARINLARAIYFQADIYLLDDPLSAVDSHVSKYLFTCCIKEFLRDKTTILVTHQIQHLRDEHNIIILESGMVSKIGSFHQLYSTKNEHLFLSQIDFNEEYGEGNPTVGTSGSNVGSTKVIDDVGPASERTNESLNNNDKLDKNDKITITRNAGEIHINMKDNSEHIQIGSVKRKVYQSYINSTNSYLIAGFVMFLFILTQTMKSGVDFFVSIWVNWEQKEEFKRETKPEIIIEESSANTFWDSRENYIYVYSALMAILIYATLNRSFSFYRICLRASTHLHNKLFYGIIKTKMLFFNQNTSGRILNRFSKDIGSIDTSLPTVLVDCTIFFLELIGILIVVSILNYWLLIPTVIMFIIFYVLRYVFLSTARNIKRVEAITRSPIFSHVTATLQGLSTIRSMSAETFLKNEFYTSLDLNTTASFLFLATTRGFAFWLDSVCLLYISIVILSFFSLGNNVLGGNVGLAVTQVLSMIGMCNWGLRQTAELENQMTSVERVMEYVELPPEVDEQSQTSVGRENTVAMPMIDWPKRGEIIFKNLSLFYVSENEMVLKNLNFIVNSKEKVGIVGRTGAGKSSIIQALFRLANLDGQIFIDNVDTNTISLKDLRSKISIIPQDPILFSGTLRYNLDPLKLENDNRLWNVLEQVELSEMIRTLDGGLDAKVADGGGNFSMGERQLICLARAILRNNKILLLDEATANVDPETDKLIQYTIKDQFKDCTILTIAHRLHTVIDYDKILVMDGGRLVEYDYPYKLLQQKSSYFYKLVRQTGNDNFNLLFEIAQKTYNSKYNS